MNIQYTGPVASLTVDCVIFGFDDKRLKLLLIKRSSEPEKGKWALPGGFIETSETTDEAATRVLEQLTGVAQVFMQQVKLFSEVQRHPMGRVLTLAYYALVKPDKFKLKASWHASEVSWFDIDKIPMLAFDHHLIFNTAINVLRRDIRLKPVGFELLPSQFTLKELQDLYEAILEDKLDRRNFRKKIRALGILEELEEVRKGRHKDAHLYKFDKNAYEKLQQKGFDLLL